MNRDKMDMNIYDKLSSHHHEIYNQRKAKYDKICQFLKEKAIETKISFDIFDDTLEELDAIPIVQEKYISNIRECAKTNIPASLINELENKILSLISKKLKEKLPAKFKNILNECKEEWYECLHDYIVITVIRDVAGIKRKPYVEKSFQCGGITENYPQYIKTRKKLEDLLLIVHPFMKTILKSSIKTFPVHLVNFKSYRSNGYMKMNDLIHMFKEDLKQSESLITNVWYPQMISNSKLPKCISAMPLKKCMRLFDCATNYISLCIAELMRRSVEYIVEITGDPDKIPQLDMELKFIDDVVITPSFDEISFNYKFIIESIMSISQKLPTLQNITNLYSKNEYINIQLNNSVYELCLQKLQTNLKRVYEPIQEHLYFIKNKFSSLINASDDDINNDNVENLYDKIKCYKKHYENLSSLAENEYFNIGKVHQATMINDLKKYCTDLHDDILNNLCNSHKKKSQDICDAFQEIATRASATPNDATDLIELGAYCLNVKTVVIDELREQISDSVKSMSQLIDIAIFSDEHIKTNTDMINWLDDIKPILDKSAIDYESIKFEMEENLITKTNVIGQKIADLLPYLDILDEMDDINNTLSYLEEIQVLVRWIRDCEDDLAWINKEETVFKFPVTQFTDLDELKGYVLPFYELIYLLHKWRRSYFSWMDGPFENIDRTKVEQQHEEYFKKILKVSKDYKNKIKQQIADNNPRRFKGLVDDPDLMNLPAPLKLCAQALNELKEWRPWVLLVNIMCNPALCQRHWDDMSKISDVDLTPNAGTTVRKLIALNLWSEMEKYEIISIGASKELALITNLDRMTSEWTDVEFNFSTHKDTNIKVLANMDNIQALLDDHIVKTFGMRGSAFVKPFEKDVKLWCNKLLRVNSSIEEWMRVQQKWLYFLPLFSSKVVAAQLVQEGIMFREVDRIHLKYMQFIVKNPHVLDLAGGFELLNEMKTANDLLEKVNNGVNEYVEKKRLYFTRFFFLSTNEILEILSETENAIKVQPYLSKCFEGIDKLQFDSELNISAMISKERECIKFCREISTKQVSGAVEKWLVNVEEEMLISVKSRIIHSHVDYPKNNREDWIKSWEGMVVICVSQMYWAENVHNCLKKNQSENLKKFHSKLIVQLNDLVKAIRSSALTNNNRITMKSLIVIDVHARDVIQELIDKNVRKDTDFAWLAQLRYYLEDGGVNVKIINTVVKYAYEYLGNTDRLVITPLTDRCYRTLIGAFSLHLYGAPEGPAGTGKTETAKDLAKALAKQCIVFNCSEGLDYKSMGRYFKGLASSGAWACFDEFNRIDIEVLSVISQQLLSIIRAIRQNLEKFYFENTLLKLNPTLFVCTTMNPGYAGRTELPDNLKILFRTIAMMVPDYTMIGEISLYSCGFLDAKNLANKIVTVYRLCSEQLSSQYHYDYGMRAVKSVISACANNKLRFPDEDENLLVLRSLTDVNLPKFLSCDILLYEGIISDLFPGVCVPSSDSIDFLNVVKNKCAEFNLEPTEYFITKILQTNQMMIVRHGFMLVGDSYSGKTSVLNVLYHTLCQLSNNGDGMEFCVINPKSITCEQLFGFINNVSFEWCDGIASKIFRKFSRDDRPGRKWMIFDGPVDAVWIENMNTVLDDTKKLCLLSSEIITLSDSMSMIFEVMDLSHASPATVSRCGMVYMESSCLGYLPFIKSWIRECDTKWKEGYEDLLLDLSNWLFSHLFRVLKKITLHDATGGEINLVISTLNLVKMLMTDAVAAEDDLKYLKTWIQASFIFGAVWGFGGNLPNDSKLKFDQFLKEILRGESSISSSLDRIDVSIPYDGLLSDYVYQYKQKGSWKHWQEIVKNTKIVENANLQQILIPSMESLKCSYLLDLHIRYEKPMLLIGPTGTGKTFYIQDYIMNKLSIDQFTPILIGFTTTTNANKTQEFILSKLNKRKNYQYGPRRGRKAIIFIDDLNTPAKEMYGSQPPIELMRQYLDKKFWYDSKSSDKIGIQDVLILAAMGPVGGSKQLIYPRLLRHFHLYSINEFSDDTMIKIYTNILQLGLRKNGFGNDVTPFINSIVNSTVDVYKSALNHLFPTVTKPHYVFNLRDIGRVIQGCSLIKKDSADNKKVLIKLWLHETMRVFYDRLTNNDDRLWLFGILNNCIVDHFKDSLNSVCENLQDEGGNVTERALNSLMFGMYLDVDSDEENKKYEEVSNYEIFLKRANTILEEYNSTHRNKINIVLFEYALQHLSKICRILSMPGGSCLLVGISGSGRQSLTKLACAINGNKLFQPEITKLYDIKTWRDDLKRLLKEAGGLSKETTFLLAEGQIIEESFLQDIDNLLNSGDIPNLYEYDEQHEILELVRLAAQGGNRNLDIHPLKVYSFFTARCKAKFHICVCLSAVGNSFRKRLTLYPSLINCCTIDWFDNWPEDALEKVATRYMQDVNLPDDVQFASMQTCKYFHIDACKISDEYHRRTKKNIYVTSASYTNLINLFIKLIDEKQTEISLAKVRYMNGLEKLNMAAEAVSNMQQELNELKPQLIIMAIKGAEMMEEIERETIEADKATIQVREDEKIANEQAAGAQVLKKDCEADLALAIPILEDAIAALNTLKPTDITLVKSMKNPPAAIKLVMAAVCVMKSIPPDRIPDPSNPGRKMLDFWGPSKRLLGDMGFLQSLKEFDKDNIPVSTMAKIRKEYLPHKDFKPHIIAKASNAAEGLCKWVIAMDMYDAVAKVVAPKKAKLQAAEAEFAATMAILDEKKAMVARLEKRVADLNAALEEANMKKQELEEEVELCINKLNRAEKLIGGLGGEKSRWTAAAENLQKTYDNLAGDILLSCGMIAYLSPFPASIRFPVMSDWKTHIDNSSLPLSDNYAFSKILGSDVIIQNWYIANLPRDQISTDNAVIFNASIKWSVFIDPQAQANKWIKKMEQQNNLCVIKLSDNNYMKAIETCMEFGKPILIENISEELPEPLNPILMKNTYEVLDKLYITIGESDKLYHKNFRLYMTSKLREPKYLPEVFIKVTVINFALSIDGLEDQLLGIVVAKERPDLQEKREKLIIENAKNIIELKNVEENILKTLQESKGDILEDEEAIEILDSSKILAVEIIQRKKVATDTKMKIDEFRNSYLPIAIHSAKIYYSVTDLPNINPMYQFSLSWFINLYIYSIERANKSKILEKRLKFLIDTFTYNLYCNVCRSLFENDKLMFSFILCSKMTTVSENIDNLEFGFLLTGGWSTDEFEKNPIPWLSDKSWSEICKISNLPNFIAFKDSFLKNDKIWKIVYDSLEPQNEMFPEPWNALSSFQKLIIIRILRPDKLMDVITEFVELHMGKRYTNPPSFDIRKSFSESNCLIPLVFIASSGTDSFNSLLKFSEKMGYSAKLNTLSLGQGQGPIAEAYIKQAQSEGSWVCLQNCHLAVSWLSNLEDICESFNLDNTDVNFRLWLTTHSSDDFPQSILQSSIKMTNETPYGLKNNLNRLYTSEPINDPVFYGGCPEKDKIFSKFLYAISFFHTVVQERKRFGSLGWNIQYFFNDSDFMISVQQIQNFLNQYDDVPFDALIYLIGECNYGGKVTDEWDRRLILTILDDYMNSNVINNPDYRFSAQSSRYNLPRYCEYHDYIKHIDSIPEYSNPETYGLNMNAGIYCNLNASSILIDSLLSTQGISVASAALEDPDAALDIICTDIIEKIPSQFDIESAKLKFPYSYEQSLNTFLIQEIEKYNKLIFEIVSSLSNLKKSIRGLIALTPDMELQANSILKGKLPENWIKISYPTLKNLTDYLIDLNERIDALNSWIDNGKPTVFWMSGFFFTQAFLTAGMQNYARNQRITIEKLIFDCEVSEERSDNAHDRFYVRGLYIDGARWNNDTCLLDEQHPKILKELMPTITIVTIENSKFDVGTRYKCPIYKTAERKGVLATTGHSSNFILSLTLPSDKPSSHWIKRSTAMILEYSN